MKSFSHLAGMAAMAFGACLSNALAGANNSSLTPVPAALTSIATQSPILAAAWAGTRAVTVGANGVVLLSDDRGKTYRQSKTVPLSSTLTSVSFIDAKSGWAVGHWGAILNTTDGGETWAIQRIDVAEDRPLFSVHFFDAQRGLAVGLWSEVLLTEDGGRTWKRQEISQEGVSKSDGNLFSLFAGPKGEIFATSEKGQVLRSRDFGRTWDYLNTGYKGSLWTGVALADGTLLVGGQRGTLMRSGDGGRTWAYVPLGTKSSITSIAATDKDVQVVGLDGLNARSTDSGRTFQLGAAADDSLTSVLSTGTSQWLLFSSHGVSHQLK